MKIPKVPSIKNLMFEVDPKKLFLYMKDIKATDEQGRYLSWEAFKYRNPTDTKAKWLATKFNRESLMNQIELGNYCFKFCVPDSLQRLLHFIDKSAGGSIGVTNLAGLTKGEQSKFLLNSLIQEEAITSAQLEGALTTRKVAKDMLATGRKPRNKDEIMIVNSYLLMMKVVTLTDQPLTNELILKLHKIATNHAIDNEATPGMFRKDNETHVGGNSGEIIHQPPCHTELNNLMNAFCDFVNNNHDDDQNVFIHPVLKAIIIHFLIGFIHPFGDGNGRTARALFYWFMLKNGYWLFEYLSISRLLKKAPVAYSKSYVDVETDELDMTYFLYYQADIIKRTILDLEQYIHKKQDESEAFIQQITHLTQKYDISIRQSMILQKAVKEKGHIFTVKEIEKEYGVTNNTARKDLNVLLNLNLLLAIKEGNARNYMSPVDIVERIKIL